MTRKLKICNELKNCYTQNYNELRNATKHKIDNVPIHATKLKICNELRICNKTKNCIKSKLQQNSNARN